MQKHILTIITFVVATLLSFTIHSTENGFPPLSATATFATVTKADQTPLLSFDSKIENPSLLPTIDLTTPPTDLWQRIRNGFAIPNMDSPLVVEQQAFYLNNADYLGRIASRSRLYLYHIVREIEKRSMPMEIALLPMIESAFNPMAYSRAHASGLWQFIPATGKKFQLEQNWWYDERRDIVAATNAALDYLEFLYELHGDWQLAIAAYNCGEGNMLRSIAKNQEKNLPIDFQSLSLPKETRYYIPKLQAVKNIISHPEKFNITLPTIPNQAYFSTIATKRNIDIKIAAKLADMTVEEFMALNPAHNRPIIPGKSSQTLVIPTDKIEIFANNLENHNAPLASWKTYQFKRGDKLEKIAAQHNISVTKLKEVNSIHRRSRITVGQILLVPTNTKAAKEPLPFTLPSTSQTQRATHTVRKGENLYTIAKRYRISVGDLKRWNPASRQHIVIGQKLIVSSGAVSKNSKSGLNKSKKVKTSKSLQVAKN